MPIAILGVAFDPLTTAQAVERIEAMIVSRRPHHLITANLDFLAQARRDIELRRILLDAHLVLCDGTPLVWASRWLGHALPERVAGSDLVPQLLRLAEEKGYRPFFLGGAPEVTEQAVANLGARFPGLKIAGYYSPPVRSLLEMDHDEIVRRLRTAQPDLLFISLGCPKAEKWIAMHSKSLGIPVAVGVGATIDFLAGRVRRAPVWMRRAGIEWIFRLLQEPRRLFLRYAADLRHFLLGIPKQWWRMRRRPLAEVRKSLCRRLSGVAQIFNPVVMIEPWWIRLRIPRRFDKEMIERNSAFWKKWMDRHWLLELDGVEFIDSAGLGCLIWLRKMLREANRELVLLAPSEVLRRTLKWLHLDIFFLIASDAAEARRIIENERQTPGRPASDLSFNPTQPISWRGEITAGNAAEFWDSVAAQLQSLRGRQTQLMVDLSELRFIDSTGLGLMIRAQKQAARHRIQLRFVAAQASVLNVIRLARLESVLLTD
ncbi:MAG: WecB/TagA/CpsF family glycosyltransferase [Verrucomicrobia bacterium]|nr:WecB/TagA/CpsF family glycosyltransferase [Verrucomicrobiota bacterium]